MEDSEKTLDVAEPTTEVTEKITEVVETQQEEQFDEGANKELVSLEKEENTKTEGDSSSDKVTQDNAKYAQIRRKAEEDAQKKIESETKKAYEKGKLEAYNGKINPYINKPIIDLADIEMYEAMFQLERDGKDPVNDLPDYLATKRRDEIKAFQEKKDTEKKAKEELEEFQSKYPNENVEELFRDSFFNDYIQGKSKSLTELYEGFNKFKNAFRNSAVSVAKQTIANAQASPGSLGSETDVVVDYNSMSSEEFEKHVQRVIDGDEK